MTRQRLLLLIVALLLIVLSWYGVISARAGLVVRWSRSEPPQAASRFVDGVPLLYIAPQRAEKVPGVLVAHGFAGSKQLMLGYAYVLAHAGYAVMLWDFGGHGANATPLESISRPYNVDIAYSALQSQPEVDPSRLALLGHSMGSGSVMSAGIRNPERFAATVAISPTGAAVTQQLPHNLQLQAGSWEGFFVANAQRLLAAAGGESQNLAAGRGRSLVVIPKAEHITILFRDASHQAALRWFDATFGVQTTSSYVDRRMAWYGLHLLGWLIMLSAVASPSTASTSNVHWFKSWGGLLLAPLVASGVLTLISSRSDLQSLGGLLVGGAVGIWFFVAGTVWLGILFSLPRPTVRAVGLGVALFVLLWVAFGAMAQVVWLQWWLIPMRLRLWFLLSLAFFPWFLASGVAQQGVGFGKRVAWWLGQSTALVGGFLLTLQFLPQLSFIFLLIPLFPILMALFSYAAAMVNQVWSYAIGCALFFGWAIAAAFPLGG